MDTPADISPLTLNRLSVYLRVLRLLEDEGLRHVSSRQLAERFELSSSQIRKDLAHFGELGVRGVGYDVSSLAARLHRVLRLDRRHNLLVVGVGNLGSALCSYLGFNDSSFRVVAGVDSDASRHGAQVGAIQIQPLERLERIVETEAVDIAVLTLPPEPALSVHERLVAAGVKAFLNFAAIQLPRHTDVRVKNVDFRMFLEELAFYG